MKYQIGEVIRFADTPNNATAGLVGKLATITNYGGIEREWYQTVVTGDKWFPAAEFEPVNGGMLKHRCNFLSDEEKMYDFLRLSKEEFLASYSYLTEEEYEVTTDAYRALSKVLQDWVDECKRIAWQSCQGADQPVSETGREIDLKESTSDSVAFSIKSLCEAAKTLNDDDLETLHTAVEVESECRNERKQRLLAGAIASAMDVYLRTVGDNRNIYLNGVCGTVSMQRVYDAIVNEFDLTA